MTLKTQSWAIAIIACVGGLGGGVVFPILPLAGVQLGIAGFMIGVILSANRLARLAFNPVSGVMLDRFGARWPIAAGLLIEALGTLSFAYALIAPRPALWFFVGRLVWGVGSSLLLVGSMAAVMAISADAERGRMTARVRSAISLGLPGGLILGGLIADQASETAAFLTATALTAVGAVAAAAILPQPTAGGYGRARERQTRSANDRGRRFRALLAMSTLRTIWIANALLFFALSGVLLATVSLFAAQRGLLFFGLNAEGSASLLMAVLMAARAAAAFASGYVLDRARSRTGLLLPAMLLVSGGFIGVGWAPTVAGVMSALVVIGVGAGGLTIPLLTLLGDVTPADSYGRALSIYQWSADIGGALGPIVGLTLSHALGFGWAYTLVGLAVLALCVPLTQLARAAPRRRG